MAFYDLSEPRRYFQWIIVIATFILALIVLIMIAPKTNLLSPVAITPMKSIT